MLKNEDLVIAEAQNQGEKDFNNMYGCVVTSNDDGFY